MNQQNDAIREVKSYYDENQQLEWDRIANRPEFLLTCRFLDRYIQPGDSVLDIGGGPGRYSMYLAEKGCQVTLLDLSTSNVAFAMQKAAELGLALAAIEGDARFAGDLVKETFDHVLLMGPLYHLLEEADRIQAVQAALALLKPGGTLTASFINLLAGLIFSMRDAPDAINWPQEEPYFKQVYSNQGFSGEGFTKVHFIALQELLPFMEQFGVEKLHLLSQEGVTAACEPNILAQPPEVQAAWMDLNERLCEREDLLVLGEHFLYIGRKPDKP